MSPHESASPSPKGASAGTAGRKHRRLRFVAIPVALLVVAAGCFLAFGGYDYWQDQKSLDRACRGILPQSEIKALMGTDSLRATDEPLSESTTEWLGVCSVESKEKGGGITRFRIGEAGKVGGAQQALGLTDLSESLNPAPIGNGWSGVLNSSLPAGYASVVLQCRGTDKDLLVSAMSYPGSKRSDLLKTSKGSGSLARMVTEAATQAATEWGCDAPLGKRIESVTPPIAYWRNPVPLQKPQGTCRPLSSMLPELRASGAREFYETPVDNAPIEDCVVIGPSDKRIYHLAAFYGPYARYLREDSGVQLYRSRAGITRNAGAAWGYAECKNFLGAARFTITTERDEKGNRVDTKGDPDLPAKLLTAFAEDATKRHGCSNLVTPR